MCGKGACRTCDYRKGELKYVIWSKTMCVLLVTQGVKSLSRLLIIVDILLAIYYIHIVIIYNDLITIK